MANLNNGGMPLPVTVCSETESWTATALMAIARKVIIFDFEEVTPPFIYGSAAVVFALGITYWLITKRS